MSAPNPNLVWMSAFVEELAASGLTAVCIAPGSRSTPLTLAFAQHPAIRLYLHLDERCASFAALGMAMASDRPVAVVCTSGTATAEFLAAVIEARQSQIPLLVLTADRPHELRHSGANQTIDQVKLYGDQVLWSVDAALPEQDPEPVLLRSIRTLAARAFATANGLTKGPVHINFPFRRPLEPQVLNEVRTEILQRPFTSIGHGNPVPRQAQIDRLSALIERNPRGLIICGPRCPGGEFPAAVAELARQTAYPLLADPLSGVRYGPHVDETVVISTYESTLKGESRFAGAPDLVLRFGAVPTSKWLNAYLERTHPRHVIHVRSNGIWADDLHLVSDFLQADETATCRELSAQLTPRGPTKWLDWFVQCEETARRIAQRYFAAHRVDAAYVATLIDALPASANLFVGNSLPVRHVDQFGATRREPLHVYANRGASGIDGTTSAALGIATAEPERPLIFVTGDVAFYHDMNGLLALRQHDLRNVTIVLLNNNGGGIFRRLPVSTLEPHFTPFFITPHELDFAHAAALYGIKHQRCDSPQSLRDLVAETTNGKQATLIEIHTDSQEDLVHQRTLVDQILVSLPVALEGSIK